MKRLRQGLPCQMVPWSAMLECCYLGTDEARLPI